MKTFSFTTLTLTAALAITASSAHAQQSTIALQEMQTMASALDICFIDTTFYVTLENLNDLSATNTINPFDSIQDLGGPYVMIPSVGTFMPRRNLATAFNAWQGPYVTYQSGRIQTGTTPYDQGSPLDPWGNPYYLFNPLGLLRGDTGTITLELYGDNFDRYTIVSLGADGVMSSDDIAYQFNGALDGLRLTSLRGPAVTRTSPMDQAVAYNVSEATTVTLHGINFGAPAANKSVYFGGTQITNVLSWTNRNIDVLLPEDLLGADNFRIQVGSSSSNNIPATIVTPPTRVDTWEMYE